MRLTLTRGLTAAALTAGLLFTWALFRSQPNFTQTCHHPEDFTAKLHELASRTHLVLKANGLTHWLCLDALWGQIRVSRALPWATVVELCVLNEELSRRDEVALMLAFKQRRLALTYDSADGAYRVTDPHDEADAAVLLVVFEEAPMVGMLRRVGWKRRLLPPDCESLPSLQCFPPRLIAPPLPLKEFGAALLPAPREGIELQKYHYPDSWWKEVLPKNC